MKFLISIYYIFFSSNILIDLLDVFSSHIFFTDFWGILNFA